MLGYLKRIFTGEPPKRIVHPVFGEAILVKSRKGPDAYWEVETSIDGKAFSVSVETMDEDEPTAAQASFFERYARDPNAAFAKAAPLLIGEYENWLSKPMPARWQDAFVLVGMSIPLDGDEFNPWELSFECLQDAEHLFTCSFLEGRPNRVSIDG